MWVVSRCTIFFRVERVLTEAIESNTRIVNNEIYTVAMRLSQMIRKALDAAAIRDVQSMIFDLRKPAMSFQCLCFSQLRILLQGLDSSFASARVSRREIDQERPVVERRLGVLEGQLAHYSKTDAL